ncbi:MAG: hypothetical protein ACTSYD_02330 [Candidatus Heimdallarchaeaceae archaeon]
MIADVVSYAIKNNKPYYVNGELLVRVETINTKKNELFFSCRTTNDIAKAYEAFWALDKFYGPQCKVIAVVPKVPEN